jgi:hypothetical protein
LISIVLAASSKQQTKRPSLFRTSCIYHTKTGCRVSVQARTSPYKTVQVKRQGGIPLTFSEYAKMLYPYCGSSQSKSNFVVALLVALWRIRMTPTHYWIWHRIISGAFITGSVK